MNNLFKNIIKGQICDELNGIFGDSAKKIIDYLEYINYFTCGYSSKIGIEREYKGGFAERAWDTYNNAKKISRGILDEKKLATVCLLHNIDEVRSSNKPTKKELVNVIGKYIKLNEDERNAIEYYNSNIRNNSRPGQIQAQKSPLWIISRLAESMADNKCLEGGPKKFDCYTYLDCKHLHHNDSFKKLKTTIEKIITDNSHCYSQNEIRWNKKTFFTTLAFTREMNWENYLFLIYGLGKLASSSSNVKLRFNGLKVERFSYDYLRIYLTAPGDDSYCQLQKDVAETYRWAGQPVLSSSPKICIANLKKCWLSDDTIEKIKEKLSKIDFYINLECDSIVLDKRSDDNQRLVAKWALGDKCPDTSLDACYDELDQMMHECRFNMINNIEGVDNWIMLQLHDMFEKGVPMIISEILNKLNEKCKGTIFEKCEKDIFEDTLYYVTSANNEDIPFKRTGNIISFIDGIFEDYNWSDIERTYQDHPFHKRIKDNAKLLITSEMDVQDFRDEIEDNFSIPISEQTILNLLGEEREFIIEGSKIRKSGTDNQEWTWEEIKKYLFEDLRNSRNIYDSDRTLNIYLNCFETNIKNCKNLQRLIPFYIHKKHTTDDIFLKNECLGGILVRFETLLREIYNVPASKDMNLDKFSAYDDEIQHAFDVTKKDNSPIQQALIHVRKSRNIYAHGGRLNKDYFDKNWRECIQVYIHFIMKAKNKFSNEKNLLNS